MKKQYSRRSFLSTVSAGASLSLLAGVAASGSRENMEMPKKLTTKPINNVRIGFVGVGKRGTKLVHELQRIEGCQITAVCDIIPDHVERAQKIVEAAGFRKPSGYARGPTDYRRLCEEEDLDLVITATPWNLHAEVCIAALRAGKHAATEVPGAQTVEHCWQMVEESEKAQKHCVLLENYCYFREVMCVLNMIRGNVFGEPMSIYTGYQKEALFYDIHSDGSLSYAGEDRKNRMGNYYPTHNAGPAAQWLDINRGDAFDYIVSMGNFGRSYNLYAEELFGPDHWLAKAKLDMTDISDSLIRTKNGRSIVLTIDTRSPRPERKYFRLQATKGIYDHIDKRIHIQGRSPGGYTIDGKTVPDREWQQLAEYYSEFEHPLWRDLHDTAITGGHEGGDYLMFYRLINALRTGTYPDIDVYDLAAWSCIVELSETSARNRSKSMDFPDFTKGAWRNRAPLPIRGA